MWIALFVDNLNLRPFDRTRILVQLETFLTTELGPADRVMLASQEDGVQIREPFTADHARIAAALAELSDVRAEGNRYDGERRGLLRQIDQAHSAADAFDRVRPYAERVLHDAERSMGAIAELADRLAGLPGQKMILHVSSGIPMLAAADLFWAIENRFRDMYAYYHMRTYGLWAQYEQLGSEVNGYDVSLYTLDASGLRAQGDITLEVENLSTPLVGLTLGRDRQENLQASLRFLADRTGGETILSVKDVSGPLARIAANLHTYYSLGYSPDHYGDGEMYTIDVRVRHDGVRVRHRDSYRDKSTATQMADGIRAALVHGVVDNPLGARLEIDDVSAQRPDELTVRIRISIPAAKLLALPDGSHGNYSNVSLFLAAIDAGGRLGHVIELPSDVPAAVADGVTWQVAHELTIPTAARALAVGVLDALSMESAFAVAQLPRRPQ